MLPPGRTAPYIFEQVVGLDAAPRARRVAELCGADADLRQEVERLLDQHLAHLMDTEQTRPRTALPPAAILAPDLPGFEPCGTLGRGSHGVVFRARQVRPPREVAIKVLLVGDDDAVRRRFAVEIAAQARLNHPGIVQVFEVGECQSTLGPCAYLVMELVADGVPLRAYVDRVQPDLRARIELLARIADALDHAHQRGVLHRDLKPDNILIVATDGAAHPKLVDFGVARARDGVGAPEGFAGTLAYCAPERLTGADVFDVRSDVYSLGVVAYEVLSGRLPLHTRGATFAEAAARIRAGEHVPLARYDRRLRGDLEAIVMRAIAASPEARYGTAREFAVDLRRHLRCEPVTARGSGLAYRIGCCLRRRPLRASGAVIVAALTMALAGGWVHRHTQARWALGIVDRVVATAIARLEQLPATAAARARCLDELLAEIAPIADALPDDPQVLTVHADLLRNRGHAARDLGDWAAALGWRQRALEVRVRRSCVAVSAEVASELALDEVLLGDVFFNLRDFEQGLVWYERAHARLLDIAARQPGDRRALDDLGCSFDRLVSVRHVLGGDRAATIAGLLAERGRINDTLARIAPEHQATLLGLNHWQGLMASHLDRAGDRAGALEFTLARMQTTRELLQRYPHEKLSAVRAVESGFRVAEAALLAGRIGEARTALEEIRPHAELVIASGEEPGQWEALRFALVDARVAAAEGRLGDATRVARSVVDRLQTRPAPTTDWMLPQAQEVVDELERAPR